MMFRSLVLAGLVALIAAGAQAFTPMETPNLAERVAKGELPPVAERAPTQPLLVDLPAKGREYGVQGGTMRMLVTRAKDIRLMVVYGYARLVGYDEAYDLVPDILRDVDVVEGRVFTFHLRRGHKWSDGHPFTSEDFRYWWEDVANNDKLSPKGPPEVMLVDGEPPVVTFPDEVTVRFAWSKPNPRFLPTLAQARPNFIYRPAHHLKTYHDAYGDAEKIATLIHENGARSWAELHNRYDNLYKFDNPKLPTLQPWMNTTPKNGRRYVLARNPYFHRFDAEGRQLPYFDEVDLSVASGGLIPAKVKAGEIDLQARGLAFDQAATLKRGEEEGDYAMRLWSAGTASDIALYPNLTYTDPVWREVLRDVRFRRALSLGIDRRIINRSLYFGLARESATAPLPSSPLYDAALSQAYAAYDPEEANRLLDEMGLTERRGDGIPPAARWAPGGGDCGNGGRAPGRGRRPAIGDGDVARDWRTAQLPPPRPGHPAQPGLCGPVHDAGLVSGGTMACPPPPPRRASWPRSTSPTSPGRAGASITRPRERPEKRRTRPKAAA